MPKEKKAGKNFPARNRKNSGKLLVRTKTIVNEVAKIIDCADPSHQRDLARKYGVSQTTVARIIGVRLGMKYKKKQKTHKLTEKQAAQRLKCGLTFRRWLSQRKLPYIVTLDEMYLYKRYNWEKGLLLRNKRETSAKRVQKERAFRLVAKNFMRNRSLPPKFNFVADCS